jgi:AraC family transcriptional regulator
MSAIPACERIVVDAEVGLDQPLRDWEARSGWRITVHDLAGVLADDRGCPLLPPERYAHTDPYCHGGAGTPDGGARCRAHCYGAVHREALRLGGPFRHRCWKGVREVVVPVIEDGRHLISMFAGIGRDADGPAPAGLPATTRRAWGRLPAWDPAREADLVTGLEVLAHGLIAAARCRRSPPDGRGARILAVIRDGLAGPLGIGDVARALGLSPSRCSHVVRACLGRSFQEVIRDLRVRRAKALLAGSDLGLRAIAAQVGLPSEAHFHRAFKAATGATPARWRRRERMREGRGTHRLV